ncbi:MAG: ATP-binding protein [Pyrinomonadaceae bacterium]
MPRKKIRYNQRLETTGDRSFQEYVLNQPAPQTTRSELLRLIRGGEDTYLELKVKLSNSEKLAKGIVALANTAGGTMIFGVSDQLRIEGVSNAEEVQQELARICREDIFPPLLPLLDCIAFDNGRRIVVLDVEGRRRPYRTKDGRFYLRIGAEKREVAREELSNWLDEIRPLVYENIPVQDASENDFDDALLWSFANAFEDTARGRNIYQTGDFLKRICFWQSVMRTNLCRRLPPFCCSEKTKELPNSFRAQQSRRLAFRALMAMLKWLRTLN